MKNPLENGINGTEYYVGNHSDAALAHPRGFPFLHSCSKKKLRPGMGPITRISFLPEEEWQVLARRGDHGTNGG
jgi:hypothetical protein